MYEGRKCWRIDRGIFIFHLQSVTSVFKPFSLEQLFLATKCRGLLVPREYVRGMPANKSARAAIQDEDAAERGGVAKYNYGIPDKVG